MNRRNRVNDGVYLFFKKPFGVLIFGMHVVNTVSLLLDRARDFTYHTDFLICLRCLKRVGSVLSSPKLDRFLFMCNYAVTDQRVRM